VDLIDRDARSISHVRSCSAFLRRARKPQNQSRRLYEGNRVEIEATRSAVAMAFGAPSIGECRDGFVSARGTEDQRQPYSTIGKNRDLTPQPSRRRRAPPPEKRARAGGENGRNCAQF
jgi:hypothetical protein